MSMGTCIRSIIARSTRVPLRSFVPGVTHTRLFRCFPPRLEESAQASAAQENLYGGHSRFIAEAKRNEKWSDGVDNSRKGGEEGTGEEVADLPEGMGKCFNGQADAGTQLNCDHRKAFPNLVASL